MVVVVVVAVETKLETPAALSRHSSRFEDSMKFGPQKHLRAVASELRQLARRSEANGSRQREFGVAKRHS